MTCITFLTSSNSKFSEAQKILSMAGIQLKRHNIDLVEIQGVPEDITIDKCRKAFAVVKGPLIVDDVSLYFKALKSLPGPYIRDFLTSGRSNLVKILDSFEDKSATAICCIGYMKKEGETPLILKGEVNGKIVSAKGDGFSWDPIFIPNGFDQTYSEMGIEKKNEISHRRLALDELKKYLVENDESE